MVAMVDNRIPQTIKGRSSFPIRFIDSCSSNLRTAIGAKKFVTVLQKLMELGQLYGGNYDSAITATKLTARCMGLPSTINSMIKTYRSKSSSDVFYNSLKTVNYGSSSMNTLLDLDLFNDTNSIPFYLSKAAKGTGLITSVINLYWGLLDWSSSTRMVQRYQNKNPQTPATIQARDMKHQMAVEQRTLSVLKIGKAVLKIFKTIATLGGYLIGSSVLLTISLVSLTFSVSKDIYNGMTLTSEINSIKQQLGTNIPFYQTQFEWNNQLRRK